MFALAICARCVVAAHAETYLSRGAEPIKNIVAGGGNQPTVAIAPIRLDFAVNQTITGSRLFKSVTAPVSPVATVRFWDSTPGAGYLTLDGVKIASRYVDATADELGRVAYFAGPSAGTNDIVIETIDGQGRSSNSLRVTIRVQRPGNQAPEIHGSAHARFGANQHVSATTLFTGASDRDGAIDHYTFSDATPGAGYFTLDGERISGGSITVARDDLWRVGYFTDSTPGQNTVAIKAFDDRGQGSAALMVTIHVTSTSQRPVNVPVPIDVMSTGQLRQAVQEVHTIARGPGFGGVDAKAGSLQNGADNHEGNRIVSQAESNDNRNTVTNRESQNRASGTPTLPVVRQVAAADPYTEMLLDVEVNGEKKGEPVVLLRDAQGLIYASEADLRRWRVTVPRTSGVTWRDETYYPLRAIPKVKYRVDAARQAIAIEFPAERLGATVIDESQGLRKMPPRPGLGGFFNYSLFGQRLAGTTTTSANLEAGAFGRFGLITGTYLARESDALSPPSVRLETAWIYDDPAKITTLRVGDSINRSGPWGNSVRFGGVQYGTNFATQPTLITSPGQTVLGRAAVPSTVDVFVNNALISSSRVPPGPFSIANIPVVTGTGDVQVVVRDAFGREQIITQPFYATPTLLRAGLSDYAIEGGFLRENYSLVSNDYGSWMASGTYRYGFTDRLTGTLRGEADRDVFNIGASADYLVGDFATISGTIAGGPNNDGSGVLIGAGISRQARKLSFNARSEWTTPDFRQLGLAPRQLPPEQLTTVSASYNFGPMGSIGAALVGQYYRDQPDVRVGSLAYNVTIPSVGFLSMALLRTLGMTQQTQFNLTLVVPIGRDYSATLTSNQTRSEGGGWTADNSATFQKSLPVGDGYGFLLRATNNGQRLASLALQNRFGTYSAEVASQNGETGKRINVAGGIGVVGGRPFVSRFIRDGFAIVRVGFPNVRVYQEGQLIGRTDAQGELIIPRMLAYQTNRITVEQLDLPMNVEIGTLKLEATPYFRSGTVVEFPIHRIRDALLQIVLKDGSPLPAGATVRVEGQGNTFPVGLKGIAYMTGLATVNRIVVEWRGKTCVLEFPLPETAEPQARIGPLVCQGVDR